VFETRISPKKLVSGVETAVSDSMTERGSEIRNHFNESRLRFFGMSTRCLSYGLQPICAASARRMRYARRGNAFTANDWLLHGVVGQRLQETFVGLKFGQR
jgi:hypothetical protein